MPAPTASRTASGAPAAGTKMQDGVRAGLARPPRPPCRRPGRGPRAPSGRPCPASRRRRPGCRTRASARAWNSPSRPVMPWTTRRVSRPTRMLMPPAARRPSARPPRPWRRPRRGVAAVSNRASRQQPAGLLGVRAHDPHDHRDVARLLGAGLDQPARDLVAAGDAAEDVDEDRADASGRRGSAASPPRPCRPARRRRCRGSWPARRRRA